MPLRRAEVDADEFAADDRAVAGFELTDKITDKPVRFPLGVLVLGPRPSILEPDRQKGAADGSASQTHLGDSPSEGLGDLESLLPVEFKDLAHRRKNGLGTAEPFFKLCCGELRSAQLTHFLSLL